MSILNFPLLGKRNLEEMYHYIVNPSRTNDLVIFGLGVNPHYALLEMEFAHYAFCTGTRNQYQQVIFSFDKEVDKKLSLRQIREIGEKIGMLFANQYQVLGALHINTNNLHFHYLINSVNINTGKCYCQEGSIYYYYKAVNEIITVYGLEPIKYYGYDSVANVAI